MRLGNAGGMRAHNSAALVTLPMVRVMMRSRLRFGVYEEVDVLSLGEWLGVRSHLKIFTTN